MNLDDEARKHNSEIVWREVSGAHPFRLVDVKDPFGFVLKFWDPKNTVEAHLRQTFSWSTRQQMNEYDGTPPPPEQLIGAVLGEFNQLIEGPCLYEERLFADIKLADDALIHCSRMIEPVEKIRHNRILLEEVCWPYIARSNGFTQNLNRLVSGARAILVGKIFRGDLFPLDVAMEAITHLADGRAVWQPQKSRFLTFANLVMRSIVSHELEKSENKTIRIGQSLSQNDDVSTREDETQIPDPGRDGMANVINAEYMNIMERFPEDSLERKVLEVVYCGRGDERPGEIGAILGVSASEVTKAKKNVKEVLAQLSYRNDGR
jgi:RNA polymerase sigma factor (sigma-70 family)